MLDRSTYVFGRVSAAIRFATQNESEVVDFSIGTTKPYQTWLRLKMAKAPRRPRAGTTTPKDRVRAGLGNSRPTHLTIGIQVRRLS